MAAPRLTLLDQPYGAASLGSAIVNELRSPDWKRFRAAVAFLKHSGLQHIAGPLHEFLNVRGREMVLSVGIDHDGTSLEGLQNLWRTLNGRGELYVFKEGQGSLARTFHPKLFLFERDEAALALIGSGNLTQGGLFSNHEASVAIELDLTDDASETFRASLRRALDQWQSPCPACRPVDAALIQELYDAGDILSEANIAAARRAATAATRRGSAANTANRPPRFGSSGAAALPPPPPAMPPMAPPVVTPSATPQPVRTRSTRPAVAPGLAAPAPHRALLIEVVPHHNGEIFLSKKAVNDDPGFFGYPFTGWATPKRTTRNPVPYPMASPDPQVEIVVYDARGRAVLRTPHSLNVVFYTRKTEIRITIPPAPLAGIPSFSLLVMTRNPSASLDYRLEFYPPSCNTARVQALRAQLTTGLPSGGAPRRRYYGWA